ncbi:MAG: tRNA (adenosine(37)-N6)-threonylcarbamoyltransferase complex dimerization subunit type 1 TsaB [Bacteroidota bacterium]
MAYLLHLETAADFCSVCLSQNDQVLGEQASNEKNKHAAQITLLIEKVMADHGLQLQNIDAVAVSAGPGSYTGLRVGSSTAKGICYALDRPLIAVDTLKALAWASYQTYQKAAIYVPMIDARRMEVYTSLFDEQLQVLEATSAKIIDEHSFANYFEKGQQLVFSGDGAAKCQAYLKHPSAYFLSVPIVAANMVALAFDSYQKQAFEDLAYFSPNYFKAPNITQSKRNIL